MTKTTAINVLNQDALPEMTRERAVHFVCTKFPTYQLKLFYTKNYRGYICVNCVKVPDEFQHCLLYTSPSPRDATLSRMPSSA